MEIIFDFSFLTELFALPPHLILWKLFINGGWLLIVFYIGTYFYTKWIGEKREEFLKNVKYSILAIDVPRENEQGPKAVEQIFAQLAVAESGPKDWKEYYIQGKMKTPVSLEIISMEGYVQFLVRTPEDFKDLAETAIYAQYPNAEITEVEDYATTIPVDFPSEEYDLWGAELVLQKDSPYPIKTYANFEDPQDKDNKFKDPMAAIMEVMNKVGSSENIWMQILIVPASDGWKDKGEKLAKKLLGIDVKSKTTLFDDVIYSPMAFLQWIHEILWGGESSGDKKDSAKQITPGERKVVEAIEEKIAKLGFETKYRIVYWADKDVFFKGRGVAATIGAIKQYSTLNMNGFVPDKGAKTTGDGKVLSGKQSSMAKAFLNRSFEKGASPYVLNTEELATIFHFPMLTVKAPLLQRAEMKSSEAPAVLPTFFGADDEMPSLKEVDFIDDSEEEDDIPQELKDIMNEGGAYIVEKVEVESETGGENIRNVVTIEGDNEDLDNKRKDDIKAESEIYEPIEADNADGPPDNLPTI